MRIPLPKLKLTLPLIPLALLAGRAEAVIVSGGNGTQNTSAAGSGISYFNNIGYVPLGSDTGGSIVYLGSKDGNYWALTARHVEGGVPTSFNFVMNRNTAADAQNSALPSIEKRHVAVSNSVRNRPTNTPIPAAASTCAAGSRGNASAAVAEAA